MSNEWSVNRDGSVTFNGTVTFPAGTNLASGAGIMILGPNGGTTNFPAVQKGDPGPSPTFTISYNEVAYGTTLPSPNPAVTVTPASGNTPPNYALTFYGHAGQQGASGTTTILTATDLEGTAQAGYTIGYDAGQTKAQWQPKLVGGWYYNGSLPATTSNTQAVKNITSLAIPAQPFAWWPEVKGTTNIVGAVDTRVDLVARINSNTGTECGRGLGAAGYSGPQTCMANGLASGSANIIAANSAATIFFNAENQTSSANPWNTTATGWFQVKVSPVPS